MNFRKFLPLFTLLSLLAGCALPHQFSFNHDDEAQGAEVDAACAYFYYSWARTAHLNDDLLEAQDAYAKAMLCDPGSQFLKRQLVELLIVMGKKEKASMLVENMAADEELTNATRIELAGIFENLGRSASAIALMEEAVIADPTDGQSLLTLGFLYLRHERLPQARSVLETYVDRDPESYAGAVLLAKTYRIQGETKLAGKMYERVLELNWSMAQAVEAAEFYEGAGDVPRALTIYERLEAEDDVNDDLRRKMAALYVASSDFPKALAQLKIMRQESEQPERLDLAIGQLFLEQRDYPAAINHFQQMLGQYPEMTVVRPMLALAHHGAGDDKTARQVLAQVDPASPEFSDSMLITVRLFKDAGKEAAAISFLKGLLADEKRRRQVFSFVLADLYLKQGDEAKGQAVFEQALELYPESPRLLFEYGLYQEKCGRPQEALAYMEKVLALDGDDALALNYIGYTWAEQGVNLDQALDYVSRAAKARPEDGFVRDSLGWVYYRLGHFDQAVSELREAVTLEPDDPTINEHLGDALAKSGELTLAVGSYDRALRLYKDEDDRLHVKEKLAVIRGQLASPGQ
ncbi:MAG: tetratricopeptide repeat protein [Thermodesulfobacteriota bacterium]